MKAYSSKSMEFKAEYGIILFLAFAGVTYRLTQGGGEAGDSIGKRLYAQFYAFLFTSVICIGLLLMYWNWHIVIVSLVTLLLAPISEKFIFLWTKSQNSSDDVGTFIDRLKRTYRQMKADDSQANQTNQKP